MWISRIDKILPKENEIIIETRSWGDFIIPPDNTFGYFIFGEISKLANKKNGLDSRLKEYLLAYEMTGPLEVPVCFESVMEWEIIKKGEYLWNADFGAFSTDVTEGQKANLCFGKIKFIEKIDFSFFSNLENEFIESEACYFSIVEPKRQKNKPSDDELRPILLNKNDLKVETDGFYPIDILGYLWGYDMPNQKKGWILGWVEKRECYRRYGLINAPRVWIDNFEPKHQSEILEKIQNDPRYPKPKEENEIEVWKRWKQRLDTEKLDISKLAFEEGVSSSKIKLGLMKLGKL